MEEIKIRNYKHFENLTNTFKQFKIKPSGRKKIETLQNEAKDFFDSKSKKSMFIVFDDETRTFKTETK